MTAHVVVDHAASIVGASISDDDKKAVKISSYAVKKEDNKWFRVLANVFGHADCSGDLLEDAQGSGDLLFAALIKRAEEASDADKAVATAEHDELVRAGVVGDLTYSSLTAFIKSYKFSKVNLEEEPKASTEVQMINRLAFKEHPVGKMQCCAQMREISQILEQMLEISQQEQICEIVDPHSQKSIPHQYRTRLLAHP